MPSEGSMAGIVKAYYDSYPTRDRETMEAIVSEDFHFTSPLDNRIDRQTYFARCWPAGEAMAAIDIRHLATDAGRAVVTYEARMKDGRRFKNTELLTDEPALRPVWRFLASDTAGAGFLHWRAAWPVHGSQIVVRRSNCAFTATMMVLSDISTAPTAGDSRIPCRARTPAASGIATTLYPVAHQRFCTIFR